MNISSSSLIFIILGLFLIYNFNTKIKDRNTKHKKKSKSNNLCKSNNLNNIESYDFKSTQLNMTAY